MKIVGIKNLKDGFKLIKKNFIQKDFPYINNKYLKN